MDKYQRDILNKKLKRIQDYFYIKNIEIYYYKLDPEYIYKHADCVGIIRDLDIYFQKN